MELLDFIRFLFIFNIVVSAKTNIWRTRPPDTPTGYQVTCHNVTWDPLFVSGMVIGKVWRTYYGWNLYLGQLCMDMKFRLADLWTVKRMKKSFIKWKTEPPWSDAVLYLTMGGSHEMMLFKDGSHIPGRFFGATNLSWHPETEDDEYDLFKMTMKLFHKGKYLVVGDCSNGAVSLLAHPHNRPKRAEINAFAATLNFGDPYPACTEEPDPVEESHNVTET